MEHVLFISYGKDSLASLAAIEKLGWPLDRIIHSEVWATDTIPADLPPMVEFKKKADAIIKKRWGIEVEHVYAREKDGTKRTYEKRFYLVPESRKQEHKKQGLILGFPTFWGNWCTSDLKRASIGSRYKDRLQYVGIAADETLRLKKLTEDKKSPLAELGWDEAFCRRWCEENDLLSPIYQTATRGGCWFCHNQTISQLRLLRKNYPELWALLLKWDSDSPHMYFHADKHTVHDLDKRFMLEDNGEVPADRNFRWSMLKNAGKARQLMLI